MFPDPVLGHPVRVHLCQFRRGAAAGPACLGDVAPLVQEAPVVVAEPVDGVEPLGEPELVPAPAAPVLLNVWMMRLISP